MLSTVFPHLDFTGQKKARRTGEQKREGKEAHLARIAQGPERIRFLTKSERSGRSPGNAGCWVDAVTGERMN